MRYANTVPSNLRRICVGTAVGSVLLAVGACGDLVAPQEAHALWKQVEWQSLITPTPQAIRSQTVEIDIAKLRPPFNELVTLSLPDGKKIKAVLTNYEAIGENQFVWRGTIDEDPRGEATFSVVNDTVVGNIVTANGKIYSIRFVNKDVALVEELDPARFPGEGRPIDSESNVSPDRPAELLIGSDSPLVRIRHNPATNGNGAIVSAPLPAETFFIDVMVLYTVAAVNFENHPDAMSGRINVAISNVNTSFKNSNVHQQIRLAHAEETAYKETGDLQRDWRALKGGSRFPGLSELRSEYDADIVVLLTEEVAFTDDSCGQAGQMRTLTPTHCASAFAVVPINCATTKHSFPHELGHVMGADHNAAGGTTGSPFSHSRGFIAWSNSWYTIMAYPTGGCFAPKCDRKLLWSNPNVEYSDERWLPPEATGSLLADNALTLDKTVTTVAAFSDECN